MTVATQRLHAARTACRSLVLLPLLVGALGGCERSARDDAASAPAPAPLEPFDVVFARVDSVELRTAPSDPIGSPRGIVAWRDRYVVADGYQRNVKVFARDGALVATIGRDGGGPGEFRSPVGVARLPDGSLAVVDDRRGLLIAFDSTGAHVRDVRLPGIAQGPMEILPGGGFLLPTTLRTDETWTPYGLFVVDDAGALVDTIGHVDVPSRPMEGSIMHISTEVLGDVVAWIPMTTNELRFADRRTGRRWSAPVAPGVHRAVAWPERSLGPTEAGFRWMGEQMWTTELLGLGDSLLVVRMSTGGGAERGLHEHRYAVVDLEGRTRAVGGPTDVTLRATADGLLVGLDLDDDGVARLRTYRLRGGAGR